MSSSGGVCIWLTGPSGAGKSTLTAELVPMLEAEGLRVSVLDVMPPVMAKQPFERSSRGKLLRKAFVAARIADHGGVAICVTVSARDDVRRDARAMVGPDRFVEVLVVAPRDVTATRKASRDKRPPLRKRIKAVLRPARRMIASARGRTKHWDTGSEDLAIDSSAQTPAEGARAVFRLLEERGFVSPRSESNSSYSAT